MYSILLIKFELYDRYKYSYYNELILLRIFLRKSLDFVSWNFVDVLFTV